MQLKVINNNENRYKIYLAEVQLSHLVEIVQCSKHIKQLHLSHLLEYLRSFLQIKHIPLF